MKNFMRDNLVIVFTVALFFALVSIFYYDQARCREAGGMPVGDYGLDCYDNKNKTFINPYDTYGR